MRRKNGLKPCSYLYRLPPRCYVIVSILLLQLLLLLPLLLLLVLYPPGLPRTQSSSMFFFFKNCIPFVRQAECGVRTGLKHAPRLATLRTTVSTSTETLDTSEFK